MGELVVGKPVLQLEFRVSLPLDLVSAMSLLYRAVPGSGLDPWLIATRRALPDALRADLDLLHGFSGRLLYYMEEPALWFEPLRPDRLDAGFEDFIAFLQALPPAAYQEMAANALRRVHYDLSPGIPFVTPAPDDEAGWRHAVQPALTTATADEAIALILAPDELKTRTLAMITGVWDGVYRDEFSANLPTLRRAAQLAAPVAARGFGMAFADLTGSRLPSTLLAGIGDVNRVTFCPSAHLGTFVSYVLHPPELIVFFGAPGWLARCGGGRDAVEPAGPAASSPGSVGDLGVEVLLEGLRALADPNRLQILDLLAGGELYAQEIVGRLGIAQSAVSRHLALLERAGLVAVRPRRGMKYYRVAGPRLAEIAAAIERRGQPNGIGSAPRSGSAGGATPAMVPDTETAKRD